MNSMYTAKVKWTGNHYESGETVRGSKIRQTESGWELFDDEEYVSKLGGHTFVLERLEWVEVIPETITEE